MSTDFEVMQQAGKTTGMMMMMIAPNCRATIALRRKAVREIIASLRTVTALYRIERFKVGP